MNSLLHVRPNACVYVVDDDAAVRRGVERLLRAAGYTCQTFDSAKAYLAATLEPCNAACLVLDIRMPEISGTELQSRLLGTSREIPIIFITGHGDIPTCVQALRAGAVGFLSKPFDDTALLDEIRAALLKSAETAEAVAQRTAARQRAATLTRREGEVFRGVVHGLLNKQIASELGIAEKTVKIHRARVMEKMAVASVAGLVRVAACLESEVGGAPWHAPKGEG